MRLNRHTNNTHNTNKVDKKTVDNITTGLVTSHVTKTYEKHEHTNQI